ncbi:hypothetical protein BJ138DRAFT_1107830 [Hygrophoropsis aurantiaca]|uniref:Uncharacterized protein n=1 Tax=Hygrophoropsis aurantiaca TaxID=72124 RepID=A0ACB7ZQ94_9AGAM|nr:hypothetical protein BJ138DRAFT_1107830 [Hygrophoropsis aurantiaca]
MAWEGADSEGTRDAEITRLCAMQSQFDYELGSRNYNIASQAGDIAKVIDIVQDQKATISALETLLVMFREITHKTEMRITDEFGKSNLVLLDYTSLGPREA